MKTGLMDCDQCTFAKLKPKQKQQSSFSGDVQKLVASATTLCPGYNVLKSTGMTKQCGLLI